MKKAFTLIELLVVVLIIGILAAVALPQYNKAVEKSRMTEALQVSATLRRALDLHVLTNGYEDVNLTADLLGQLTCSETSGFCCSKYFCYKADCVSGGRSCQVSAYRYQDGDMENGANLYDLDWYRQGLGDDSWNDKDCVPYEDKWKSLCSSFRSL